MLRLSLGSWSSCLRMYSQSLLVSSVSGSGSLPTSRESLRISDFPVSLAFPNGQRKLAFDTEKSRSSACIGGSSGRCQRLLSWQCLRPGVWRLPWRELGRVEWTLFTLEWLQSPELAPPGAGGWNHLWGVILFSASEYARVLHVVERDNNRPDPPRHVKPHQLPRCQRLQFEKKASATAPRQVDVSLLWI